METREVYQVSHVDQLVEVAEKLLTTHPGTRIFAFYGPMGVGKTTFIKALCRVLGSDEIVSSPTFSIVNQYLSQGEESIFHFDFYRIKNVREVYDIGYEDYFYSGNYCFIEWPEKVEALLPDACQKVYMREKDGERMIEF